MSSDAIEGMQESPISGEDNLKGEGHIDSGLMQTVCQEVLKALKSKGMVAFDSGGSCNFAGKPFHSPFVSNAGGLHHIFGLHGWIVDTGASDHMSPHLDLFVSKQFLSRPIKVSLPDGSMKEVKIVGSIVLHPNIILREVLYVPEFKYSLL